jgi:hypothetical protein
MSAKLEVGLVSPDKSSLVYQDPEQTKANPSTQASQLS